MSHEGQQNLERLGAPPAVAPALAAVLESQDPHLDRWRQATALLRPDDPFEVHQFVHQAIFSTWDQRQGPAPAWAPSESTISKSNLASFMRQRGIESYAQLHAWSVAQRREFWDCTLKRLDIAFETLPTEILDTSRGAHEAQWLVGGRLNIADSCFRGSPQQTAIVFQRPGGPIEKMTSGELRELSDRVCDGLVRAGFAPGDALGIAMPMTAESVAIYLGIVRAGMVVVSIADSFSAAEMATRLRIAEAKGVFSQDVILRGEKALPLYARVREAVESLGGACRAIVLPANQTLAVELRPEDSSWGDFLGDAPSGFASSAQSEGGTAPGATPPQAAPASKARPASDPMSATNILFSSGTTGDPKAIVWSHITPIKAAADGHWHHDIKSGDVVAWPTNLGWMMGPWLIYASLINRAALALYYGPPQGRDFAAFVQDAGVTMLGVVPSLVKTWRQSGCLKGIRWTGLRAFSSTGECSNAEDMLYLMSRAGYRPVIEYCGGTEIGGGYITGTVIQPSAPSTFSTPALGLDFEILDEAGQASTVGELFLRPPSIGLSTRLLNRDHAEVYYADTPVDAQGIKLRRHGDQIESLPGGYFRALGRADDTMNLGGIKVSSAEIERSVTSVAGVRETAAIAVNPVGGGPSLLVLFAVLDASQDPAVLKASLQKALSENLNPLFKLHDAVSVDQLPRTASNKVMRRVLRDRYLLAPPTR